MSGNLCVLSNSNGFIAGERVGDTVLFKEVFGADRSHKSMPFEKDMVEYGAKYLGECDYGRVHEYTRNVLGMGVIKELLGKVGSISEVIYIPKSTLLSGSSSACHTEGMSIVAKTDDKVIIFTQMEGKIWYSIAGCTTGSPIGCCAEEDYKVFSEGLIVGVVSKLIGLDVSRLAFHVYRGSTEVLLSYMTYISSLFCVYDFDSELYKFTNKNGRVIQQKGHAVGYLWEGFRLVNVCSTVVSVVGSLPVYNK